MPMAARARRREKALGEGGPRAIEVEGDEMPPFRQTMAAAAAALRKLSSSSS